MDYDSPWKEAMDRYFEWFMRFFFPRHHALIDWSRDSESLDSELRKLAADAETGKRHVDKLVSVSRVDSNDRRLAHIEFQARKEAEFPLRLHIYNYTEVWCRTSRYIPMWEEVKYRRGCSILGWFEGA